MKDNRLTTDAETLACPEGSGRREEFVHFRELEHERQAEEEIYAAGGWISGHCADRRCAL
jgi:hypothetical protein